MLNLSKEIKWYSLDNAAKIFPPSKSKKDPKIFRFSVTLFDEVKVDVLNKALNETLDEYPIFKSSLRKGIFCFSLDILSLCDFKI